MGMGERFLVENYPPKSLQEAVTWSRSKEATRSVDLYWFYMEKLAWELDEASIEAVLEGRSMNEPVEIRGIASFGCKTCVKW